MRLRVTTARPLSNGSIAEYTAEYRLQFHAEGRGQRLLMTLVRLDSGQGQAGGSALTMMLGPMVGRPVAFLVSGDGARVLLQDGDALWAALADKLAAETARAPVSEAQQLGGLLLSLPPVQREAMLAADVRHMLRFAGRDWPNAPAAAPPADTSDCGLLTLVERDGGPGAGLISERRWQVDALTGLVRHQREERWMRSQADSPPQLAARTERLLALD